MASKTHIERGTPVLQAYIESLPSWAPQLVKDDWWATAASAMVDSAAAGEDQSPGGKRTSAAATLQKSITDAGLGAKVTLDQCRVAADKVLVVLGNRVE